MKKLTTALLLLAASTISNMSWAETFVYETDRMQNDSADFSFPGLNLDGAKASLYFTTDNESPNPRLTRLLIDFENAKNLVFTDFSFSKQQEIYTAKTNKGWVFSELSVEVIPDFNQSYKHATIRLAVPEYSSNVNNIEFTPGVQLFFSGSPVFDISRKRLADSVSFNYLGKRVNIKLKDRILSTPPRGHEPGGSGFELNIDWLGHGFKTVYFDAPMQETDYGLFEAVGLMVEEFTFDGQTEYTLAIKYRDKMGNFTEQTPVVPMHQILEGAFGYVQNN